MSFESSYSSEFVQPHVLCDLCKSICESSVYIQTYVRYGSLKNREEIHHRCNSIRQEREKCAFHTFRALLESYERGCHLCSMLWLEIDHQISPQQSKLLQSNQQWNKPLELFTSHSGRDLAIKFELKIDEGLDKPHVVVLTSFLIKDGAGNL